MWVHTSISDVFPAENRRFHLTPSHESSGIRKMPTEPPSLFQGHVPAIMSAGQGTHIVFMAEVHSLQGLPGYALHQVLWHPVGKKPTGLFWPWIINSQFQGKMSADIAQGSLGSQETIPKPGRTTRHKDFCLVPLSQPPWAATVSTQQSGRVPVRSCPVFTSTIPGNPQMPAGISASAAPRAGTAGVFMG